VHTRLGAGDQPRRSLMIRSDRHHFLAVAVAVAVVAVAIAVIIVVSTPSNRPCFRMPLSSQPTFQTTRVYEAATAIFSYPRLLYPLCIHPSCRCTLRRTFLDSGSAFHQDPGRLHKRASPASAARLLGHEQRRLASSGSESFSNKRGGSLVGSKTM
jgi:hypothetical protein